ncbi:MAG: hypothetical protein AMXMBFR84_46920 [Candidatus Hydrogenedentota bacterium]
MKFGSRSSRSSFAYIAAALVAGLPRITYYAGMGGVFRTIKVHWNRSDSVLTTATTLSFVAFVANAWFESAELCYVASIVPLGILLYRAFASTDSSLWRSLVFGALVGIAWPFGEALVTLTVGWWGDYDAPGFTVLYTPLYCILIGWLASTYLYYLGERALAMGFSAKAAAANTALAALVIGAIGENLFVAARMWHYDPSILDIGSVPLFVPVAYGIGYGVLPLVNQRPMAVQFVVWVTVTLVASVGLGLVTGFFPR